MITSVRNQRVQRVRALQSRGRARRESQAFVVEGVRLGEEALAAGRRPELVLFTMGLNRRGEAVLEGFRRRGAEIVEVAPHVMEAASDTRTPQGLLAVLPLEASGLPPPSDLILLLDGVRDPGNMGTILRTAAAAGAGAVLLAPGTVDAYTPKVVRAAMGAHFRLPIYPTDWTQIADYLERSLAPAAGRVFLAEAGHGEAYTTVDFRPPLADAGGGGPGGWPGGRRPRSRPGPYPDAGRRRIAQRGGGGRGFIVRDRPTAGELK